MNNRNPLLVGIVLPAFNEGSVIGDVLDGLPESLNIRGQEFKIRLIVINDGSSDNTAEVVSNKKTVTLINHIINSGAGAATRTGLNYAYSIGCDYVVCMDSDGQHSAKDVIKLIDYVTLNKADFVIGNRLIENRGNMPTQKKIGNIGLGLITYLLLGVYSSDSQSGLKALNRKAIKAIDFFSNDYAFCSEMIGKAHQKNLSIKNIPIEAIYTDYSLSRGQRNYSGAFKIINQLLKRRLMDFING